MNNENTESQERINVTAEDLPKLVKAYNENRNNKAFHFRFETRREPALLIPAFARYMIEFLCEKFRYKFERNADSGIISIRKA